MQGQARCFFPAMNRQKLWYPINSSNVAIQERSISESEERRGAEIRRARARDEV